MIMDLNIYNCQQFKVDLEEYHKLNDVSKISSLRTVLKDFESLNIAGPATIRGGYSELDQVVYTCIKHTCVLPCVCYLCNDKYPDHKILHPVFFDPKTHLFTVRNAGSYDINWNEDHLTYGNKQCTNRKCSGCVAKYSPERERRTCLEDNKLFSLCVDCPNRKSLDVLKYAGIEKSCSSCQLKLCFAQFKRQSNLNHHYNNQQAVS